jgi:hypothetical protein
MIRAYVNRQGGARGPVIVELWQEGERTTRTFCQRVTFKGKVELKSVFGEGPGFVGFGGAIHTWVESDADRVAAMEGVTHTEGKPR